MSPFTRACAALVALLAAAAPADAQASDERAAALLREALQVLGGAEYIAGIRTWHLHARGRENLSAEAQGTAPASPTWREHEERIAVDVPSLTVAWERRTPRNDHSLRWRRMIFGADGMGFVDHVTGRGMEGMGSVPANRRRALARRVPHLLLHEAATTARSTTLGRRPVAGDSIEVVRVTMTDSAQITLFLTRAPLTLRRAEYVTHLPTRGDVTVSWRWDDWRPHPVAGRAPARQAVVVDGTTFQEVTYERFEPGADITRWLGTGDAQAPPSGTMPAAALAGASGFAPTGEVAPGVHVASVDGFVVLAVEFTDFVVAVETPEGHPSLELIPAAQPARAVAPRHRAWVDSVARGRPIRYAVVSHHHSDHMGGVREFVRAGATALVAAGDVDAARRTLAAPHDVSGDTLPVSHAAAAVEGIARRRVITDGVRALEILPAGENPHTSENLVVWLPQERILFQGDLFYFNAGTPFPPSGRETVNRFFADWVAQQRLEPLAIYGVHNTGAAGPNALARARGAR